MDQWLERWQVPGSNGNTWTVARKKDGSYGCSCPAWKFARAPKADCHHILGVKMAGQAGDSPRVPEVILAHVREVHLDKDGNALTPLIPIGDIHFALTVAYDLARVGVPMLYIREHYLFGNSFKTAKSYIEHCGRRIYGPLSKNPRSTSYEIVPV